MHARIGGVLEELYEAALGTHASELAYHFAQAGGRHRPEKVVEYSNMAGELALHSYAYEDAEVHFRCAQASWEGQELDGEPAEILYGLARAVAATGGRVAAPEVLGYLRRAFQHYLDVGDVARAVEVAEYPVEQYFKHHRGAIGFHLQGFDGGSSGFPTGGPAALNPRPC